MRPPIALSIVLALATPVVLAQPAPSPTIYFVPDVPTDDPSGASATTFLPWNVVRYRAGTYAVALSLPPNTFLDAVHRMDRRGRWLLSVEVPTELPPGSGIVFQPEDVILYDASAPVPGYSMFLDGSAAGIPPGSNLESVFLVGGDSGDPVIGFDVPTVFGGTTYDPADLVRLSAGGIVLYFDASASGGGVATSSNVTDACQAASSSGPALLAFALDVPTDLASPLGAGTYLPGQIVSWNGSDYGLYTNLAPWPTSSLVHALSCGGNPGRVYDKSVYPFPIQVDRSAFVAGNIVISWSASCSQGAEDYGIYEGRIGSWYSHTQKVCTDAGSDLREEITPQAADSYYLVVPQTSLEEGSYGRNFVRTQAPPEQERPAPAGPADRCVVLQNLTPCP